MKINILCFGITKEIIGNFAFTLETPDNCTNVQLIDILKEKYPKLNSLSTLKIALNSTYAPETIILKEGDEIALIPPVSGG